MVKVFFFAFTKYYNIISNIQRQRKDIWVLHLWTVENVQKLQLNQMVLSWIQTFQLASQKQICFVFQVKEQYGDITKYSLVKNKQLNYLA